MIEKYGETVLIVLQRFGTFDRWSSDLASPPPPASPGLGALGLGALTDQPNRPWRETQITLLKDNVVHLRSHFESLGFTDLEPAVVRVEVALGIANLIAVPNLPADVKALRDRFEDRLKTEWYFHVPAADRPYCGEKELFGDKVTKKFPKALEDIEEAGTCLALGRGTACVFHLMRAMEVVVQRLSTKLGIPNPDREWGKLLSDMGKAIDAMPITPEAAKRKRNKWSEAHTHLYHVKQAWRNETMHPKKTYTQEQAREVFSASRVFMNHLAGLV